MVVGTEPTVALPTSSAAEQEKEVWGGLPANLLWLPYAVIAFVFLLFLGLNFYCYHRRNRERLRRKREALLLKSHLLHRRHLLASAHPTLPSPGESSVLPRASSTSSSPFRFLVPFFPFAFPSGSRDPVGEDTPEVKLTPDDSGEDFADARTSITRHSFLSNGLGRAEKSTTSTSEDEPYSEPDLADISRLAEAESPEAPAKNSSLPPGVQSLLYQRKVLQGDVTLDDIRLEVGRRSTSVPGFRDPDHRLQRGARQPSQSADTSPRLADGHPGRKFVHPIFTSKSAHHHPEALLLQSAGHRVKAGADGRVKATAEDSDPTDWTFFSQERVHGFLLDWGNSPTLTRSFKRGEVKGREEKVKETAEEAECRQREEAMPFMDEDDGT